MLNVIWSERKSPVLSSSNLRCLSDIPSINLTSGCAHDCIYCYAQGYSIFPEKNKIVIYRNILDKIKGELRRKKRKPRAVYFSPSSDIFQPVAEVLEISHSILDFLLAEDIGVAFLTKGKIPDKTLNLLLNHADRVSAQIGIITHDDKIRKMFEPNAASIDVRLGQMAKMSAGGISVEARLVPIIPGITDIPGSIERLYDAISTSGVKHAAVSTLFLRPAITMSLKRRISDRKTLDSLLGYYKDSKRMAVQAERSSIIPLPQQKREETYNSFRQIGRKYGLKVSVCGCMNPDIGGTCNISGTWPERVSQPDLFDLERFEDG